MPAELRVVEPAPPAAPPRVRRLGAFARAGALAALGLLAWTVAGLNAPREARVPRDPAGDTRALLEDILERGAGRPEVAAELRALRESLGRRPLDARTRSLYAVALLGAASDLEDLAAAEAHARRALETAPVTLSVVRRALQVLARTGDTAEVVRRVRAMFAYEPAVAARTLLDLRPWLGEPSLDAVPDEPDAWAALARELRARGFDDEADAWILEGHEAWPGDRGLLRLRATVAVRDDDWRALDALFPDALELERTPADAALFAYRALGRARAGAPDAAREAAADAIELAGGQVSVLLLAGEALHVVGEDEQARRTWSRALFLARGRPDLRDLRRALLERLARLEDASGRPSRAVELWRDVLELEPDHVEARARLRALAGPP